LSKSNVKSKIICNNQQQGQFICATQVGWNQCVGHYFYGKEKLPDAGNQVFLPHKLLLFDVRERFGDEQRMNPNILKSIYNTGELICVTKFL